MSETPKEPATGTSTVLATGALGGALSAVMATIGSVAGAGWPGVIALGALGLGMPLIWSVLVKLLNSKVDQRDLNRAGADAGETAVDLQNQGREVSQGLDAAQKMDPPKEGF